MCSLPEPVTLGQHRGAGLAENPTFRFVESVLRRELGPVLLAAVLRRNRLDAEEHRQWLRNQKAFADAFERLETEGLVEAHRLGLGVGHDADAAKRSRCSSARPSP